MAVKNEPVGEVICPTKGCELKVSVFKYRPREHENMRRFAGKLYCRCPEHGQQAPQEYLLENANIWGAEKPAGNGRQEPAPSEPATVKKPGKLPAMAKAPLPATDRGERPAMPAAEPARPARKSSWGFFE